MANLTIRIDPIFPKGKFPENYMADFEKRTVAYFEGKLARTLTKEFEATVKNWDHRPSFPVKVWRPYGVRIQLNIDPAGKFKTQWVRVSLGTKPHFIYPKLRMRGNGPLVFQTEYDPHTKPGGQWGGPGRKSGPYISTYAVRHPGIEPRAFAKEIAKKHEKEIAKEVQKIMRQSFRLGR